MTPKVTELDNGLFKPSVYQVFVMVNGIPYWLTRYGYVPPVKQNVRHYSTFKTRENAERAASKPVVLYRGR